MTLSEQPELLWIKQEYAMCIRRPRLRIGLLLALLMVVLAVASCTGQDPSETDEAQGPQDAAADDSGGEDETADADGDNTVTVVAIDNEFTEFDDTAQAGTVTWELINEGNLQHDIVIEEAGDTTVADAMGGETETGTIDLDPGEYTFYCSIPGHRATMEETITIQ